MQASTITPHETTQKAILVLEDGTVFWGKASGLSVKPSEKCASIPRPAFMSTRSSGKAVDLISRPDFRSDVSVAPPDVKSNNQRKQRESGHRPFMSRDTGVHAD
jgi:hypothetical protein